ncbi:DNA repair protein RecN [Armatimonadota bacterium]|nr:DNA repair protein RecN [Armatimonadota bacterium]
MLRTLSIRNFAIIDRLELEFGAGFNVLTGETGAGKSIIMDALSLILGGRAGAEMIRTGAERALLDAVFDISHSPELQAFARESGFDVEDDLLFLSREVQSGGKSSCRVMGRPATVAQLRAISEWLVDLHGQHEHQSLLTTSRHIDMLDEWGGKAIQPLRADIAQTYHQLQSLRREKSQLEQDARERTHLLDLYQFQSKEIQDANLRVGEDEELQAEHRRVANAQRLAEIAGLCVEALGGGNEDRGVLESLSATLRALEEAAELDKTLLPSLEAVRNAGYELREVERDLSRYQDSIEFQPERLAVLEERIDLIRTLQRKYGDNIEEVLAYADQIVVKLEGLSHSEERGAALESEILLTAQKLTTQCEELTSLRTKSGERFVKTTLAELVDLGMEKAQFAVQLEACEPTSKGADKVEFLIATNPGEPLRPLAKIASGGEISRVMLAIKSALARQEALPTMVFDEIDVGVGGRTASVLADKMVNLSQTTQILCITHLAQIASCGQRHFYIEKQSEEMSTRVTVVPLTPEERVLEIARMIGGTNLTDTVLQHAREMLGYV